MGRKKKHEEHENHERWLVSYADFITLLFAFFTSMYAISSVNEGKFRILSESLAIAFSNSMYTSSKLDVGPAVVRNPRAQLTERFKKAFTGDYQCLKMLLHKLEKTKKLTLLLEERGVVIRISEGVLFPPASAEIAEGGYAVIDEIASALKGIPNAIKIEGHTDNIPISTPRYPTNWDLSSARAIAILKYLVNKHHFDPERLVAVGYGEFRPVASNDTVSGRARNRRVDIVVLNSSTPDSV